MAPVLHARLLAPGTAGGGFPVKSPISLSVILNGAKRSEESQA